ncbi:MAG: ABC transporter, partial [Bacilli bacterium]|nr:ABC transporter [Bacilli bacterium]
NGKIAARGTPYELRKNYANDSLRLEYQDQSAIEKILIDNKLNYSFHNGEAIIPLKATIDALTILDLVRDQIKSFEVLSGTLNDAFINITGKEIRE